MFQSLLTRLHVTMRRINLAKLVYGFCLSVLILSVIWLFFSGLEMLWLPIWLRTSLFILFCLTLLGLSTVYIFLPLFKWLGWIKDEGVEAAAKKVGAKFPQINDKLVNLLQLVAGKRSDGNPQFLEHAIQSLSTQLSAYPIEKTADFNPAKKLSKWLLIPTLITGLLLILAPQSFLSATKRLASPGVKFLKPALFHLFTTQGDVKALRGSEVPLSAYAKGQRKPQNAQIEIAYEGEEVAEKHPIKVNQQGFFDYTLKNIQRSQKYRFVSDDQMTDWYEVALIERPAVTGLRVNVDYPSYAKLASKSFENVGDVTGLPGTKVNLTAQIKGDEINDAQLQFEDGTMQPMTLYGGAAAANFTLTKNGSYRILLQSKGGLFNENATSYNLNVLPDDKPNIALFSPMSDKVLANDFKEKLEIKVSDDYGLSKLRLFYRIAKSEESTAQSSYKSVELPLQFAKKSQDVNWMWDIAKSTGLKFYAGDVLEYFVQVWDNNSYAGYQTAKSAVQTLKLPSDKPDYENLQDVADDTQNNLENLLQQNEQTDALFQELKRELRENRDANNWDNRQQIERIQNRKQEVETRLEDVREQFEEMQNRMEEEANFNPEQLRMMDELKRMTEELNTPEMMEALRKLEEAMQQMNRQEQEEAMEEYEAQEEQYQEQLERIKEMFERLKTQAELMQQVTKLQELAETQKTLQKEMQRAQQQGEERRQTMQRAQQQQQQAQQQMQQVEREMRRIEERLEQQNQRNASEVEKLRQELERRNMPQRMQENKEQMQQNDPQEAQEQQEEMEQELQEMSQMMMQQQQQSQGQQNKANMKALRRMLDNVLTLSQEQENLANRGARLRGDNPALRAITRQQSELGTSLNMVADSLKKLARNAPQVSRKVQVETAKALADVRRSTQLLTDRQVQQAVGEQKSAMTHLNELALMLSEVMSQMQQQMGQGQGQGQSRGQMMQMLRQMQGQQQGMGQQIQQMLNQQHGQRLQQGGRQGEQGGQGEQGRQGGQGRQGEQGGQRGQQQGENGREGGREGENGEGGNGNSLNQMRQRQEEMQRRIEEMSRNREIDGNTQNALEEAARELEESQRNMNPEGLSRIQAQRQQNILVKLLEAERALQQQGKDKKREAEKPKQERFANPNAMPEQERQQSIFRDMLRSLERGYHPDFEALIRRYFELLQEKM